MRSIPRSPAGFLVLLVVLLGGWLVTRSVHDESRSSEAPARGEAYGEVDRVVDGDTAKVWVDGRDEYVRYIGIDAPESVKEGYRVECFGEEASKFNQELLDRSGGQLRLLFDREKRDQYGRLLAYVYSGGTLLQAELLKGGYATTIEVPPNTSMAERFSELEAGARKAGRGGWGSCGSNFGQ